VWRPIVEGLATLEEIDTHWSLTDLLDANDALDVKLAVQVEAAERPPQ
jgi:hypothetical protein